MSNTPLAAPVNALASPDAPRHCRNFTFPLADSRNGLL